MSEKSIEFHTLVHDTFQRIARSARVFVTAVGPDDLYRAYISSFPEGTNPIFKKNTEHECGTCQQFIRRAGVAVTVDSEGLVRTTWDDAADTAPYPYDVVSAALRDLLRASPITNLYRVPRKETSYGAKVTRSQDKEGNVLRWHHLHSGGLPDALRVDSPGKALGEYRDEVQVFQRGLVELHPVAVMEVLGLIDNNALYKGEEFRHAVLEFQKAQNEYLNLDEAARRSYPWTHAKGKFRGSAIGKLVDALSGVVVIVDTKDVVHNYHPARLLRTESGDVSVGDLAEAWAKGDRKHAMVVAVWSWLSWEEVEPYEVKSVRVVAPLEDLEGAVKAYEAMVAPANYKRPRSIITQGMVNNAMKVIGELGLEPALERRFARIEDISVNDVKWVDIFTRPRMKGGLSDVLAKHVVATAPRPIDKDEASAEPIALDYFVQSVLPNVTGLELLLRNNHLGNFMVLTAPVHPEFRNLFKWQNDFAWSYCGNVADSIKELVRKAGGKVEGATLRVSLSWFNFDDLDLHIIEPNGRDKICFSNKRGSTGGVLDVDMNAGGGATREPVENIVWTRKVPDGDYRIVVNNYCQREMSGVGFVVEVEHDGKLSHFSYNRAVQNRSDVHVATLHVSSGVVTKVDRGDPLVVSQNIAQVKWGLTTEDYVKVNAVTLSPNYWGDSRVGNRHTFFFLDSAKCDEPMRGIYNEFLDSRLDPHRKVFEIIGDKTKCQPTEGQMAGVGFSSTKKDSFVVRAQQGGRWKLYNIQVGA